MSQERGRYIVIEGNDGTGKSTQIELLADYLASLGKETLIVEEPGSDNPEKSTPINDSLRSLIKNGSLERSAETNLLLFTAARRELYQQKIAPALARGAIVLCARNYLSTLAYQGKGEGLDEKLILQTTKQFVGEKYMHPEVMIVLTLANATERMKRIAKRGKLENPDTFESRDALFQNRVNQAYIDIAHELSLQTIDASASIKEVQRRIRAIVDQ